MWNPAEGITVSGTTATIAAATGNRAGTDAFVDNAPGWFFTHTEQVSIEKDKDYPLTAAMKQQVRELTLVIEPTGDAAGRITEIGRLSSSLPVMPQDASRRLQPA